MPDLFVAPKKTAPHRHVPSEKEVIPPDPTQNKKTTPIKPDPARPNTHAHALTAYSAFPDNIIFANQEKEEIIHLFVRQHIIINLGWISLSVLLFFLPFLIGGFLLPALETLSIAIPASYLLVLVCFYYLILFFYGLLHYVSWFYNAGIVTSMRVVDIDVTDITHKNVAATAIADLVDVTYAQKGFLQSTFDYGNVHIQTEGLKPNFEFLKIPQPAKAADVITDLIRRVRHA